MCLAGPMQGCKVGSNRPGAKNKRSDSLSPLSDRSFGFEASLPTVSLSPLTTGCIRLRPMTISLPVPRTTDSRKCLISWRKALGQSSHNSASVPASCASLPRDSSEMSDPRRGRGPAGAVGVRSQHYRFSSLARQARPCVVVQCRHEHLSLLSRPFQPQAIRRTAQWRRRSVHGHRLGPGRNTRAPPRGCVHHVRRGLGCQPKCSLDPLAEVVSTRIWRGEDETWRGVHDRIRPSCKRCC